MLPAEPRKYAASRQADAGPDLRTPLPPGFAEADAGPPAGLSAAPSLGTLMHAFRRCWRLAVPVAFGGAAVAAALTWMLIPSQYTTTATFRILVRPASEEDNSFASVQKAQVALLKSHDVLAEAIQMSKIAELYGVTTSPPALQKKLTTAFLEGPEILTVTLSSPHPEAAAALLNALGKVYPSKTNLTEKARIEKQIEQLEARLAVDANKGDGRATTLGEQLRDKRIELGQAEKKAGLEDAAGLRAELNAARSELSQAKQRATLLRAEIVGDQSKLESRRRRVDTAQGAPVTDLEATDSLRDDPRFRSVLAEITKVEADIKKYIYLAPSVRKRYTRELEDKLEELDEGRKALVARATRRLRERNANLAREAMRKEIAELEDKIQQAKTQDVALAAEIKKVEKKVEELESGGPRVPASVLTLRDQVSQLEAEVKRIGDQLAALKGSLPLPERVARLADAFVPTDKDLSRPLKFSVASGGFVLACLLGGVCLLEARGRRVYTSGEVMAGLGLPLLGTLPRLPAAQRVRTIKTISEVDPLSGMTEAVDAVRTVLLHAPRVDGARVVMVASAVEGEGKSTLSSHLAASLARAWRKTLLIDGDLRNPNQHTQFDQPLEPGLCEALRGEVEFEDAVKPTPISRLWLLSAGRLDAHALQALAQEGVGAIFDWLKDQYDFIVIDSSPVLPVPDALMLGQQADAVILSVMKDVSRMPAVYQAQQRLESLQIRVLGTVVIGEKTERYGHAVPYGQPPAN